MTKELTPQDFKEAAQTVIDGGFTSHAPLGASGDRVVLSGTNQHGSRQSIVSVRLHSGGVELLLTTTHGDFVFYGKYHASLGSDFIGQKHYECWKEMRQYVESDNVTKHRSKSKLKKITSILLS